MSIILLAARFPRYRAIVNSIASYQSASSSAGKLKRNPVAFLGPDIVGVAPQFRGLVPPPEACSACRGKSLE